MTRSFWGNSNQFCSHFLFSLPNIVDFICRQQDFKTPYDSIKRNLRQLRVHGLPKPPTNCAEIKEVFEKNNIFEKFGYSKHQNREKFYNGCFENKSFSYCVFSSMTTIKLIEKHVIRENLTILMDGTFKIVPLGCFKQILIIYAEYSGKVNI